MNKIWKQHLVWQTACQNETDEETVRLEYSQLEMFCHNEPDLWVETLLLETISSQSKHDICGAMFLHGNYSLKKEYHVWIKPYFQKVFELNTDGEFHEFLEWVKSQK